MCGVDGNRVLLRDAQGIELLCTMLTSQTAVLQGRSILASLLPALCVEPAIPLLEAGPGVHRSK